MKEFDWEKFKDGIRNIRVHCKTEEEANDFLKLCDKNGIKWSSGEKTTEENYFNRYSSDTTYGFYYGFGYGSKSYCEKEGYSILEWEDYMNKEFTKDDLQADMVVVLRDGRIGHIKNISDGTFLIPKDLNHSISNDYDLKMYSDDLTNNIITCFDIMKVFGFCKYYSQEYDYSTTHRELLWERKEKSAKDIEIESIQAEMDKLSKRLDELKEGK